MSKLDAVAAFHEADDTQPGRGFLGTLRWWLTMPLLLLVKYLFRPPYKKNLVKYVSGMIAEGSHVLDFGCNEGDISTAILAAKPSLTMEGLEVQFQNGCSIPVTLFDGERAPFEDGRFEYVIVLDVLHHTRDIKKVLAEAARLSSRFIIIKDHHVATLRDRVQLAVGDFLGNLPYGIPCAFNYPTMAWWHRTFAELGLEVVEQVRDQDYGFNTHDNFNFVYKLARTSAAA